MLINNLEVKGFRNYSQARIDLVKGINAIYGENGSGKTNILEAIHWISTTKSFRTSDDANLVNDNCTDMAVLAKINKNGLVKEFDAEYSKQIRRKNIRINGNRIKRHADIVGELPIVMFSPENIMMVKGEPRLRRSFIDTMLSMINKEYLSMLNRYSKAVSHRNYILKQIREKNASIQNLEIWDEQISEAGAKIVSYRVLKIKELNKIMESKFNKNNKSISVVYQSELDPENDEAELKRKIVLKLKNNRAEEIARATTLTGPHRDDLEIKYNGKLAKIYASEGQQRLSAIILKLAEGVLAYEEHQTFPVILLDDFSSELDEPNRQFIKETFSIFEQIIITTTYKTNIKDFNPAKEFHVEHGIISELS